MIENNYKQKIIESIESNIRLLKNGISELEKASNSKEKANLNSKEMLLDAVIELEIAVYRSKLYNITINKLSSSIAELNMNLNALVSCDTAEEFTHILSYKLASLLTFIIDHIN